MSLFAYNHEMPEYLENAINEEIDNAVKLLSVTEADTPEQIVSNIRNYVDHYLINSENASEETKSLAITLGCAWASCVIKEYGWHWRHLGDSPDNAGVYIVSPNEYYCCPPLFFLNKIMQGNNPGLDKKNDNTVLLLFHMLDGIEKNIPAEKYTPIS